MLAKIAALILCIKIGTVLCQDEPVIANVIYTDIKRVGQTGILNCTVIRKGTNTVHWIQTETALTISSDDDIRLEDSVNKLLVGLGRRKYEVFHFEEGERDTYQLHVNRLTHEDNGSYTCQIQYRGATEHPSKDGLLIVLQAPSIVQAQTSQMENVRQGENVNLKCNAFGSPVPNITWIRPNGRPMPQPHNRFSVKGNRLLLENLQEDARGVYRCIADNNVRPPASHDVALYIQFAPTAKAVQDTYGQAQNRLFDITIECRIAGFPEPDLMWYKVIEGGKEPITDDDKHNIHVLLSHDQTLSVTEFWYQLTIINVQGNDYGDYICEGSNRLGKQQATVKLYETSECQGAWCPQESQVPGSADMSRLATLALVSHFLLMFCLV